MQKEWFAEWFNTEYYHILYQDRNEEEAKRYIIASLKREFASDSGTGVGGIKSASQGYFSIDARDGEQPGYGVADSPYKKVRVVTTIDFYLD